jgi:hypothetical protein
VTTALVEKKEHSVSVSALSYWSTDVADGVSEGTLWCVEALTRAGQYDPELLEKAVSMFEVSLPFVHIMDTR